MKNSLVTLSAVFIFVIPYASAESLFDKIKRKADEIIAEQDAKADQKIDQTIDETVDSAEQAVYEGNAAESNTSTSAGTNQTAATGDNANAMLVKMAQTELKRLGYPIGVDGKYGPGTRNAILAFEADKGLALSGNVSPGLINTLRSTPSHAASIADTSSAGKSNGTQNNPTTGDAITLLNECKAKTADHQGFDQCAKVCLQAAMAPEESMLAAMHMCTAAHQAAFNLEAKQQATQKQPPKPATPAPMDDKAKLDYLAQFRMLISACEAVGETKMARGCVQTCRHYMQNAASPNVSLSLTESLLVRCQYAHDKAVKGL